MAGRIRSIKPEILDDEKCAALSHLEFRVFVGSWLIADDYGNLRGEPDYVRGQIVWGTKESRDSVANAIDGLVRVALLVPYSVRGQSYLHVVGWEKHQRIDKRGKRRMPGHDDENAQYTRELTANSQFPRISQDFPATDLRPPTSDLDHDPQIMSAFADPVPDSGSHDSPGLALLKLKVDTATTPQRQVVAEVARITAKPRKSKTAIDASPAEQASVRVILDRLGSAAGVAYRGCDPHTRLIVNQLRDGITEAELRAVVAYCSTHWDGKPEMRKYLRPETLFGPQTIAKYLDPARTEYAKEIAEAQRQQPKLEVVR